MDAVDHNDMTAAELLRWAAGNEMLGAQCEICMKLYRMDGCGGHDCADWAKDLADKIDAEIDAARWNHLADIVDSCIEMHGYPSRREGERFDRWLERCFIQCPLDEGGEPVQFGDRDIDWDDTDECRAPGMQWDATAVDCRGMLLATTFNKIIAVAKTDDNGRVKRPAPEVLGGDGLTVVAGETVYTETNLERVVAKVGTVACDGMEGWDGTPWVMFENGSWLHSADVTHTPPDTQERIDEDARKYFDEYWGCIDVSCDQCPVKIDGEKPRERFGTNYCSQAIVFDLLRRQRELDKRTGGAE